MPKWRESTKVEDDDELNDHPAFGDVDEPKDPSIEETSIT